MEIRQLEYFITSVEERSFYKASEKLYVSQPAISKAISLLEKELDTKLFDRTNKGLKLTSRGEKLYHYAKNILKQVSIMKSLTLEDDENLRIASYPSYAIAEILSKFYTKENDLCVDYREGTVQDIIDLVYSGISEFGIIYISPDQADALSHILSHKHLEFIKMKDSELCVFAGNKNKLYDSHKEIDITELSTLKYIRGSRDFFSVEHHFDYVNLNKINTNHFDDRVMTNSDHLVSIMLEKTDLCYLGIEIKKEETKAKIKIKSDAKNLILGYIKNKHSNLSSIANEFLLYLNNSYN